MMKQSSGFTLVELITVVVILGILAVVALPRLGNSEYKSQEFRDKVVSGLRYAQKTAVSHRRMVCVTFTGASMTLSIAEARGGACGTPLLLPGSSSQTVQSPDASKAYFSAVPADFNFGADGISPGGTISIENQPNIVVVGATGYVN